MTAAEEGALPGGPPNPAAAKALRPKAEAKVKRFTLAALASQHAGLRDLVTALTIQLQDVAAKQDQLIAATRVSPAASPKPVEAPRLPTLISGIPCLRWSRPPPPTRQLVSPALPESAEEVLPGITGEELTGGHTESPLAEAMLLQAKP